MLPLLACVALSSGFEVVGYLPEYRYGGFDWETVNYYTVTIFFSLEVDSNGRLTALDRLPKLEDIRKIKGTRGKRLVSVGGAGRSNHFGNVLVNKEKRLRLQKNVKMLIAGNYPEFEYLKGELHGIDLNYEAPQNDAEWRGLSLLAKAVQKVMMVTVAYHPHAQEPQIKKHWDRFKYVTWFHAMAYNHPGSSFTVAQNAINAWRGQLPMSKMILGIPFYGRLSLEDNDMKTYREIIESNSSKDNLKKMDGFGFDGVRMVTKKVKLAHAEGLAGVMVWEMGQDVDHAHVMSLSRRMHDEVQEINKNREARQTDEL